MRLNKIDLKILYNLDYNARISLTDLSQGVGISKQNLNYRLKKLIKDINGLRMINGSKEKLIN